MSKFKLFLEQSKFESKIINESKLDSCEVSKRDKTWTLNVKLKEVVSVADLKPFLSNLKSYFLLPEVVNKVKVKLSFDKIKKLNDFARDYFEFICREIADEKSRFLAFLSFKFDYKDEKYTIHLDKDSEYLIDLVSELKSRFHDYGLTVEVEAIVDEEMKTTIEALENAGLRDKVKVIVGGAPVTQHFADAIGADGYAPDASSAVDLAKELIG